MPDVLVTYEDPIAVVALNRPERRNALTVEACKLLVESLEEAAQRARVIVLTGEGTAFCAGGDFKELARFASKDPEEAAGGLYSGFQQMIRTIRKLDVPVIAAVNGHAMGAGMDLALACDLRIAATEARLGQVWVRVGLVPGTAGAFWVTWLAGPGRAAEMILTGESIEGETALEWGLVNEVVAQEFVVPRSIELAKQIATNPPEALAANKRLLNEVIADAYEAALEKARAAQTVRFASEEFRAAIGLLSSEDPDG